MPCFALLITLLCSAPAQAAETARLYQPLSATPKSIERSAASGYSLYLSAQPAGMPGALGLKVRVRSASKHASGELLLTLSAKSADRKSLSTRQARFVLEKGQGEKVLAFVVEGPACGPVDVVAALFEDREPLTRSTARLKVPCEDAEASPPRR